MPEPLPKQLPHRIAVLLTAITFVLIWLGALGTSWDARFIDHAHQLLGLISGLLAVVFGVDDLQARPSPLGWPLFNRTISAAPD